MTETESVNLPPGVQDQIMRLIGEIASGWAAIELCINEAIWTLAEVEQAYGACMTAQIYTLDGRLKALLSLLKLRRAPDKLITMVNKFTESARGPLEKRNRAVHDPWGFTPSGKTAKIEITANRKLVFNLRWVETEELVKDRDEIGNCVERCNAVYDAIMAALPSLPEIPQTELRPIVRGLRPSKRNRST